MERALSYEYLIRAVYKCGRGGKHGADADIYRWMYSVESRDKGFQLGVIVGRISAYLSEAFNKVISLNEDNTDFVNKIEECSMYLREPTVDKLDKCIIEAWEAFSDINLKA